MLLSLMVVGRWLVVRSGGREAKYNGWLIVGYIAFCFSNVFTFGLTPETGLVGNIITAAIAVWLGARVYQNSALPSLRYLLQRFGFRSRPYSL